MHREMGPVFTPSRRKVRDYPDIVWDSMVYRRWKQQARCYCRPGQENWLWENRGLKPEARATLEGRPWP